MTFQIINAVNTDPVPSWLTIVICVAIFIAASVVSGFFAYKYWLGRTKRQDKDKNDTDISR